jgi:hypothetical protein
LNTVAQYDEVTRECEEIFLAKNHDYGPSWRILRPSSITDQLLIKARRIRSIEVAGHQKISDSIRDDYIGLVNYSAMALVQLMENGDLPDENIADAYKRWIVEARILMMAKNHDYGEVWRDMRLSSITDLILMKLLRVKQIEDNEGKTTISEGLEANYLDIINYAVFALIKLNETVK